MAVDGTKVAALEEVQMTGAAAGLVAGLRSRQHNPPVQLVLPCPPERAGPWGTGCRVALLDIHLQSGAR